MCLGTMATGKQSSDRYCGARK